MNKVLSIIATIVKRSKAVKAQMLQAGIPESLMQYNKISLAETSGAVQAYVTAVNAAIEELAEKLTLAGVPSVVGEEQFANAIENAKALHSNPLPASAQSLARKQCLIASGEVPADLWEVAGTTTPTGAVDLAEGLELGDLV